MNMRLYIRLAATFALSGCLTVIPAPASAAEKKAPEPPRTLEDLLLQAEQMAGQQPANQAVPAAPNAVPQPVNPQQIVNEMQRLIAARDQIVARSQLFQTLRELRQLEPQFLQLVVQVQNAQRNFNAAQNQLNVIHKMAANAPPGAPGPDPAAVAAAQNSFNHASQQLRAAANDRDNFFVNNLRPRFQRVQAELPGFFQNYVLMRTLVPLDRQHPASGPLLAEVERSIAQRVDFVEGHILAGILYAYAGNANSQAEFKKASNINEPCGLAFSLLGYDCCYGLVMAGAPNDIPNPFIAFLKKLDPKRQTTAACWLIGARAFSNRQHNEATTFLHRALTKANGNASPQLLGELSWLYLFVENKQNIAKAENVLGGLSTASAWQVKRAHAGLAADKGAFDRAIALMKECRASAPPAFDAELAAQQNSYESGKSWLR